MIADDRVFVTVADDTGEYLEARRLSTGDLLWGPKSLGLAGGASLAFDAGHVFAIQYTGTLTAFDAVTGAVDWSTQLPGQYAFTSPPTATSGTVYVGGSGSGGTLYAVDEATGDVSWKGSVENGDSSSPTVSDDGVYVSYACQQSYKFTLSGALTWHHSTACEGGGGQTAVLHGSDLYVPYGVLGPVVLDADTGAGVGTFSSQTTPAFDGNYMATLSGGRLAMWDTVSGDRLWVSSDTDVVTAPLFTNRYVVEGRSNGTVELRDEDSGEVRWSGTAGGSIAGPAGGGDESPYGLAVGDGALVVPAGTRLSVFFPASGPHVALTRGPSENALTGRNVSFSFESGVDSAAYDCTLDGRTRSCDSPVTYRHLEGGDHTFSVHVAGSTRGTATRDFKVDPGSPSVRLSRFHPVVTHAPTAASRWQATDSTGVKTYQLRVRWAPRGSPLSPWTTHRASSSISKVLHLHQDSRTCVSVRAENGVGNWSRWTQAQCVVRERRRH